MEYKYYRELKHNYLVVKSDEEATDAKESYQVRILENRSLKGFLPCDIRTINNEQFLYYEINSMQSLKDLFSSKGMDRQQLYRLFKDLKSALEGLSDYLLGIENVVFDTGSIFMDLKSGDYKFMYYPYGTEDSNFSKFIDELFDIVDHDDERAVEIVYSCSEKAQNASAPVLDLVGGILDEEDVCHEEPVVSESEKRIEFPELELPYEDDEEGELFTDERKAVKKSFGAGKKIDAKVQMLFSVMFFILIGVMVYIRMNYILTNEENVLSIIVMIVSMVTGLAAFLSGIRDMIKQSSSPESEENSEQVSFDDINDDSVDLSAYRKTIIVTPSAEISKNRKTVTNSTGKQETTETIIHTQMSDIGETVVLDQYEEGGKDITLYSRNADKTIRIPLDILPVTIGKLEGCVDKVISDKSISRIHCRFEKDSDGRISLTDLNSTNGTFRNGLKLAPQEKNYIEEGDEVRIGRICFDCR